MLFTSITITFYNNAIQTGSTARCQLRFCIYVMHWQSHGILTGFHNRVIHIKCKSTVLLLLASPNSFFGTFLSVLKSDGVVEGGTGAMASEQKTEDESVVCESEKEKSEK